MFVASYHNTMRNARPKPIDPDQPGAVRTIDQARQEKRGEAERLRRIEMDAWVMKMAALAEKNKAASEEAERREKAKRAAQIKLAQAMQPDKTPVALIIERVAKRHGITSEQILGQRRDRASVVARHFAVRAVADARPDLTLAQISRSFNRDHASITHALKKTPTKSRRSPAPSNGDEQP